MVKARLILRNDSTSNFQEKNPVLLQAEPAYDNEAKLLKIGDGVTPWNELPGISIGDGSSSIPIATQEVVGGVLSSLDNNKIKVEEDGTMSLNKVSTSLLYVPENEELILNGDAS